VQMAVDAPFTLGVVSDEISPDPVKAARGACDLGLASVEVNTLWGKPSHRWTDDEVDRAAGAFADAGLPVLAVCPILFKPVFLPDEPGGFAAYREYREHLDILDHALALAHRFHGPDGGHVPFVRAFSFRRPWMDGLGNPSPRLPDGGPIDEETLDVIAHGLRPAAERARDQGVTLVLENVRSCWGNSGTNAARIIERVDSPALRILWDPANAYVSGEEHPSGWRAVRSHVAHVHLKDASVVDPETGLTRWRCIGEGGAHIAEEVRALCELPYRGAVHIETHWIPDDGSNGTSASYAGLVQLMKSAGGQAR